MDNLTSTIGKTTEPLDMAKLNKMIKNLKQEPQKGWLLLPHGSEIMIYEYKANVIKSAINLITGNLPKKWEPIKPRKPHD